jgi:hypothetical protein
MDYEQHEAPGRRWCDARASLCELFHQFSSNKTNTSTSLFAGHFPLCLSSYNLVRFYSPARPYLVPFGTESDRSFNKISGAYSKAICNSTPGFRLSCKANLMPLELLTLGREWLPVDLDSVMFELQIILIKGAVLGVIDGSIWALTNGTEGSERCSAASEL